ncbi:MAG: LrgA-associated rane protein LrgB [Gemmatimonadetes bacterium]|jgi:predicted murein hydrolase (TIGR00659 family)|nr:LrgA-associated rane protein LrgB [Gemmatimonadota bacterium]
MTSALWLVVTVLVYLLARAAYARTRLALLNPALVSIAVMIALVVATRTPYERYMTGGRLLSVWLGPAVVALGLPLALQLATIRRNALAIGVALAVGSLTGIVVAVSVAWLLGAAPPVVLSLAPRSATTPIAMVVAARLGGIPALSAVVSIVSGALGGFIGVGLLHALGVRSPLAVGLALGGAAHGLGTARAADEGPTQGATAGMAMGAVGVLTALLAPVMIAALRWFTSGR